MTYNITKTNLSTGEKTIIRSGLTASDANSMVKSANRAAAMPTCGDEFRYSMNREG